MDLASPAVSGTSVYAIGLKDAQINMFLYLQANIEAPATHKPITAPSASARS